MPVPDRQLRVVLGGLCLLSVAAMLQQIGFPRVPRPAMPAVDAVALPDDLPWRERGARPAEQQRNWARSRTLRLEAAPAEGSARASGALPPSVQLALTRLVARRPENLQVAALTRSDPELSLQDRRLLQQDGQELALGRIGESPALQACLVPDGRSGITSWTLGRISGAPPRDRLDQLQRLLGLRPHRSYDCLLVTLRDTSGRGGHERLLELWAQRR
ncbi:MAG: hypothetical protein VKI81_05000 [Synechococcaceae cyanobacterium]|nr:hypothetical protein [Synechococcaceae cyanobacterium]